MKNKNFILNNKKLTQTKQLLIIDDLIKKICMPFQFTTTAINLDT